MPTTRRWRTRDREAVNGLPEVAYEYFSSGPFFDAETWGDQATAAERKVIWRQHREAIIERYHRDHPEQSDRKTWGETLEELEGACHADQ